MKKILTVVGARPQFIKASALSKALADEAQLNELLVHTGQHFDENMSAVFFDELDLPKPAYHLGISGGSHGAMTGEMLKQIEPILMAEQPDFVLVYGDTNSTLAGALAAAKLNLPIAHIEAGLRSFNKRMPEELNRILTDQCASLLFTPTQVASQNLLNEGFDSSRIKQVGDIMFDVAIHAKVKAQDQVIPQLFSQLKLGEAFILATIHRQENTDDEQRLKVIFEGLNQLAQTQQVVLPLHPRTQARLERFKLTHLLKDIKLTEPLSYLEMVALESRAALIITDSGGVQKEAFFHQVPCLTLRNETEWTELVVSGWNHLLPPRSAEEISKTALKLLNTQGQPIQPYGQGQTAQQILEVLKRELHLA